MKRNTRFATFLLALIMSFSCAIGLTLSSCSPEEKPDPDIEIPANQEFLFTGSGKSANGRTFNFEMTGDKDSSLLITVKELPSLTLSGTWKFIDGKGYKIYLNDSSSTLNYTQYDTSTKTFTFTCAVDMGSYGAPKVNFTYKDVNFASSYDGIGLGKEPPVFNTVGWVGGVIEVLGTLTCDEEGNFITNDTWHQSRVGTWEFDSSNNQYIFTPTDDPFYETYLARVEAGTWTTYTYKPWRVNGSEEENMPAQHLTKEDLESVNWFRNPVICAWNEELGCYKGEMQLSWRIGEITRFILTFEG